MVSVIIPLYNKDKYIRRAVDSVLAQTFREFELIIVNDGSTDNGPAIVRGYDDPRIRVIDQKNKGVSAARNRGIAEAKAELITFLDADDEWLPDFLALSVEAIESLGLEWSLVGSLGVQNGDYLCCHDQPLLSKTTFNRQHFFQFRCRDVLSPVGSIVLQRSILECIGGFNECITHGEDVEMWWRIGLHFPYVAYNPSVLMVYHLNTDGRATNLPRDEEKLLNFWKAVTSFDESGIDSATLQSFRIVRDSFANKAMRFYLLGGYRMAAAYLMKSPKLHLSCLNKVLGMSPYWSSRFFLAGFYRFRELAHRMIVTAYFCQAHIK